MSIDQITKDFDKRIRDTEDDAEKRTLELEKREAIADFREQAAVARELEAHRTRVVAEKGLGEWSDMVTGSTAEEIEASATKIADRLAKVATATATSGASVDDNAAARAAYGASGAGSGGGGMPAGRRDETVEKIQDFERRFNESTRGSRVRTSPSDSPATVNVNEGEWWTRQIGAARLVDHLAKNSSNPRMRDMASRIDPNTLKERGT